MQDCRNCIHEEICRYREQREALESKTAELVEDNSQPLAVQVVCQQYKRFEPTITKKEPFITKIGDWPPGIQIGDRSPDMPYTTKYLRGGEYNG